jgi:hypothetical protein
MIIIIIIITIIIKSAGGMRCLTVKCCLRPGMTKRELNCEKGRINYSFLLNMNTYTRMHTWVYPRSCLILIQL